MILYGGSKPYPVSATPTAFALRIGQFPAGEGWQKSLLSSVHSLYPRPPCTFSGRADNACTNLLGYLVRCVRSRGMAETVGSGKTAYFHYILCRTHLPRTARATNSCTPRWFGRRTVRVLLADFWYFSSQKSMIKEKFLYFKDNTSSVSLWLTPSAPVSASPRLGNFALCGVRQRLRAFDGAAF